MKILKNKTFILTTTSLILSTLSLISKAIIFFTKIGLLNQENQSFNIIKSVDAGIEIIAIVTSILLAIIGIIGLYLMIKSKNTDEKKELDNEQLKIKNLVQTTKTDCSLILNITIIFSEEDKERFLKNLDSLGIPYNTKIFDGDSESLKEFLNSNKIVINKRERKIDENRISDSVCQNNVELQIDIIKLQLKDIKNNDYKLPIPDLKNLNYSNEGETMNKNSQESP